MLDDLETTLSDLESHQLVKRRALQTLDAPAILAAADREGSLVETFERRLSTDELRYSSDHGSDVADTLSVLIQSLPDEDRSSLAGPIESLRRRARKIKQEVAVTWLATYRVNAYVGDMLSLIAHAGQPTTNDSHQGLMLDSTA